MPKIVIVAADFENNDFEVRMAKDAGVDVALFNEREPEAIIRNAADADGVVTSYGKFPPKVFEALPNLRVVSRTGIGYDDIDVPAATKNGTAVCVVPGYGTEVVSDHAITLALCVLRRLNETDADMRAGIWDYTRHRPYGQVFGRVFGVVGMGEIGRATARKAAGLGFRVVCCSRSLIPGRRTPEGYDILEYEELMKDSAVVVNTSRGAVIDTLALAEALQADELWGAGIDVFEGEPVDSDHPLMKAPHTVLSPHVAYWSEESGIELRTRAMQAAIDVVTGVRPKDCLNPEAL